MAGFNIESAHSYTMDDDEFYMELLETFVSGEGEKAESIRKLYEEEDWKNYQIMVHGLKSAARTIGDDTLADLALAQEMAAKEGRIEDIRAGVDELISTYHESAIIVEGAIKD
jgi:HPt (histidine-containing phosphotransfer) domain-containing protein